MNLHRVARKWALAGLMAFAAFQSGIAAQAPRIDGSSDAAAEKSFQLMTESMNTADRLSLIMAVSQLDREGAAGSAEAGEGAQASPAASAAKIKEKIAGMTAPEIVELARRTSTTKASAKGKHPGIAPALLRPLQSGAATAPLADTTWAFVTTVNGRPRRDTVQFLKDHSASYVDTETRARGSHRWEQSGNEVRLSVDQGYSVYLGEFGKDGTLSGQGGNTKGSQWTWTATRIGKSE
jgi:hypothetical protein